MEVVGVIAFLLTFGVALFSAGVLLLAESVRPPSGAALALLGTGVVVAAGVVAVLS